MLTWLPPVDWSESVEDIRRYRTDVLTATDGNEQRRQLRGRPRRTIRYQSLALERGEATRLLEALQHAGAQWVTLPLWCDASMLTASVSAGGTTLVCETEGREFQSGEHRAALVQSSAQWELLTVHAVGPTGIVVTPTTTGWPIGTAVVPLCRGRVLDVTDMEWVTDHENYLTVVMEAEA